MRVLICTIRYTYKLYEDFDSEKVTPYIIQNLGWKPLWLQNKKHNL